MKLTVKLRVVGGFAIISLLLLIIGFTAYSRLSSISRATAEVNDISIPALENSALKKGEFAMMSKISLQATIVDNKARLAELRQQFLTEQRAYEVAATNLNQAVQQQQQLRQANERVTSSYNAFISLNQQLFDKLANNLDLQDQLDTNLSNLEMLADDMAALLLDFTDISNVRSRFPRAYQAATQMETGLNTLISVAVDLNRTQNSNTASTISNDINFRLQDLASQLQLIQTEASQINLVSELAEKLSELTALVSAQGGYTQTKALLLQDKAIAEQLLLQADEVTAQALTSLDELLNQSTQIAAKIQQESQDSVSNAVTVIFMVMLASILVAIFIAYRTVSAIIRPLAKINSMLGIVASGDLTQQLNDRGHDEFADLSRNINKVNQSLQQLIQGIITRSNKLAEVSEQTSAITVQTTQGIREQKSQVTQAATATTEMSSTAQGVLQSANDTLTEIKNADKEAERVKGISLENKAIISQLSREVDQASHVINQLHKDSSSIGSILDVIRGIAEQTNLLALNAAIEAARAGEQGRGFAVVADEVRSLASKTQTSTQEIQAMIQALQTGAQAAVEAMDKGKKQAEDCVAKTEVASSALDSITHAVHLAHDMSVQISSAAKEQHHVSSEISGLLESIVAIAEQTATGAEQTSSSSHAVAKLAAELRQSVAQFKV